MALSSAYSAIVHEWQSKLDQFSLNSGISLSDEAITFLGEQYLKHSASLVSEFMTYCLQDRSWIIFLLHQSCISSNIVLNFYYGLQCTLPSSVILHRWNHFDYISSKIILTFILFYFLDGAAFS